MAQLANDSPLKGLSGKLGELVFRQVNGRTIVTGRPRKSKVKSPAQKFWRNEFMQASARARELTSNPETKARYAEGITKTKKNAYTVALSDYLNPPTIHIPDCIKYNGDPGQCIDVKVTDDFRVKSVQVMIFDIGGRCIEHGEAYLLPDKDNKWWQYVTRVSHPVTSGIRVVVFAHDYAGNIRMADLLEP